MFKFMLSVALGLSSASCFARAEPLQSPVTSVASFSDFQYFRSHFTRETAIHDAQEQCSNGRAQDFRIVQGSDGLWQVWLR